RCAQPTLQANRKQKNAALKAAFCVSGYAARLVPEPRIIPRRQGERAGQRRLVDTKRGVVEHAAGAMRRQLRVVMVATLARERLGARIEVGALLDDDAGALAAVLVAADVDGAAPRRD